MRRNIVWEGSDQLKYEIREIVEVADRIEKMGVPITWENIGDPVQKGEEVPGWIKAIVVKLASENTTYGYVATAGYPNTRAFLAEEVNKRGGCRITQDDIIFFNGLGDAVSTLFAYLKREARVIGPSPAYSTLSSAEAAHSGYAHPTYLLDHRNSWMPNLDDLENKIRYNDSIAGILLINPDNPTGAVYPEAVLRAIIKIAEKYDLFILCDETYAHVVFNGAKTLHLSEVIGEVPGIALRSISKEFPWPGARCGWMEVFNQNKDPNFRAFIKSLIDAKRLEVCSTALPQMAIPHVVSDPRYKEHLKRRNTLFEQRAREAVEILSKVEGIYVTLPQGALYLPVLFNEHVLTVHQSLQIKNSRASEYVKSITEGIAPDKRFVYYLMGATGICVVPLTGFCSDLQGFRMTLLETNDKKRRSTVHTIADAISQYLSS
ncbi:MAG: pyridoxal phosphate-dependent aminotransferase [Spirochaetota bacterium]